MEVLKRVKFSLYKNQKAFLPIWKKSGPRWVVGKMVFSIALSSVFSILLFGYHFAALNVSTIPNFLGTKTQLLISRAISIILGALGQVMQRMRLNFCGSLLDDATPVKTFKIVFGVVLIYTICDGLFDAYEFFFVEENGEVNEQMLYIRDLGVLIFSIWSIFIMAKTRWYLRAIYAIPEERCVGCEDIMCSVFCPCCTGEFFVRIFKYVCHVCFKCLLYRF